MSVTCTQFIKQLAAILSDGLIGADTLREQEPLDPIDVRNALADKHLALAADPPLIFLLARWSPHH